MKKGYLKKETDIIIPAHEQPLTTNNIEIKFFAKDASQICRQCGESDETVTHIVTACPKLVQNEDKKLNNDNVARIIRWELGENGDFQIMTSGINVNQKFY